MQRLAAPELPGWLTELVPFERYRVQVGPYRMHLMEAGQGIPVLMLHGNPTWGFLWRKVAAALAGENLRLIMPDLVGLGFSDKPIDLGWHSLERHAEQVAGLIDALGLRELIFVGQDWGGPIGGAALSLRPAGTMAGAVILNTALTAPKPEFRGTAFHRFARLPLVSDLVFRLGGFPQRTLWIAQGDRSSIRRQVARAYHYPLRGFRHNAAPLALARMVPDSTEHPSVPGLRKVEAFFEQFRGPTEIVWGQKDPILGRALKRTHALLPHANVTRTEAGHFLQEEVPDQIAAAIRRVAARLSR